MSNNNIIQNIKATMAIEGFEVKYIDVNLINQCLNKEITEQDAVNEIKNGILSRM